MTVQAQLKAVFTVDTISGCAPFTVKITESSKGNPTQYFWDFGNGQTSTLHTPAITYNKPGTYTVTETVTSGSSQSSTSTNIYVHGVSATFTYTYEDICDAPATISFVADSIDYTTKYHWEFGDNNKSIDAKPDNTYTTAGKYSVQLITINPQGCQDTSEQWIQIGKGNADFLMPDIVCVGQPVSLTNNSLPLPQSTIWSLDNTTLSGTNAVYTFNKAGSFNIKMDADFGACKQSVTKQVDVLSSPKADFDQSGTLASCTYPATVTFTNNSTNASSYKWLFGDGQSSNTQNATHTYSTAGIFNISLVAFNANGCTDTLTKAALVKLGPPIINGFNNLPISGCIPITAMPEANITSPEAIVAYDWDFGDGQHNNTATPTHVYTTAGYYRVTLTVQTASGCSGTYSMFQAVAAGAFPPVADFSVPSNIICGNTPVQFSGSATAGTVTSWNWDFGDGSKSSLQNPLVRYTSTGSFTITLYVSDKGCNSNTQKKNFLIVKPPISKIQPVYHCDDRLRVDFKDQSIQPLSWQWDFGDGSSSNNQDEMHIYKQAGEYHVKLTTINNECSSTADTLITVVTNKPKLAVMPENGFVCRNDSFAIYTDHTNSITDYLWNLADDNTTFGNSSMQYVYKKNGTYKPSLIVSYVNGCKDTSTLTNGIQVYGPNAGFSIPATSCLNGIVVFTDNSNSDGLHAIKKWQWNAGEDTLTQQTVDSYSHQYTTSNTYIPTLKITDAFGCTDSVAAAKPLVVKGAKAAFNYTEINAACNASLYAFIDQSVQSNDMITQYKWSFGDGDSAFVKDPQHYYTQTLLAGQVSLSVVTADGCADTVTKAIPISIAGAPKVSINAPATACMNQPVHFTAIQDGNTSDTHWLWDFGNGATSNEQNTTYTYDAAATYKVQLIAIAGNSSCADTATQSIILNSLPAVHVSEDMIVCVGKTVNLSATGAQTYTWQPAINLSCAACATPVSTPVTTTRYYVRGVDSNGCANEDSVLLTVQQQNQLRVDKTNLKLCLGDSAVLNASGADTYLWQPALGLTNPAIANPVANPQSTTTYTVTDADEHHCFTSSAQVSVVVDNKPSLNIIDSVLTLNRGAIQRLQTRSSSDVVGWLWQPQQGLSCYNCATPLLTASKSLTYTATASTEAGCSATDKIQIEVMCDNANLYIPSAFTPNGDGRNDRFYPLITGGTTQKIKSFDIYSSTGQMIFSKQNIYANSYIDGWDGTYKGFQLNGTVYIYRIEVECDGKIVPFTGTVSLIR